MKQNRLTSNLMEQLAAIDSDTPATAEWLRNYLRKQKFDVPEDVRSVIDIKIWLVNFLDTPIRRLTYPVNPIVEKLVRYWRVHKSRRGLVSVSVSLSPDVAKKLTEMARGTTKQSVITQLIEGNYLALRREKNEQKAKKQEAKNRLEIEKEKIRSKAYLEQKIASKMPVTLAVPDEFKASVSQLYHILFPEKCSEFGQESELPDEPKKTD